MQVPARHVFTDRNDLSEYGYDPGEPHEQKVAQEHPEERPDGLPASLFQIRITISRRPTAPSSPAPPAPSSPSGSPPQGSATRN
ncbi:hypothetical protein D477_011626 [Arthrobacter crystallopoietes BAB-32]|uniref:Uncharacterized protein n=1 Tax=Arthrobacter crystallopoietes BAB-32 TaxID=1246476 RepID=N1UUG6_9MICC|nr:hypothetical protein [Arthrobacter crystallopoietes]EMY34066.1 hypothetical protein D477_011626 [Arthrobacter crystallopoietes BAB-32]